MFSKNSDKIKISSRRIKTAISTPTMRGIRCFSILFSSGTKKIAKNNANTNGIKIELNVFKTKQTAIRAKMPTPAAVSLTLFSIPFL